MRAVDLAKVAMRRPTLGFDRTEESERMTQPLRRSSKQVYAPNALRQKTKLRVDEAATLLDVHEDTVRRWLAEGKLAGIRTPGGHWRVRAESLKPFL